MCNTPKGGVQKKIMKTHFIFNYSVVRQKGVLALIHDLMAHRFPVTIVSPKKKLRLDTSIFPKILGGEVSSHLEELYLLASPKSDESRYLTLVFCQDKAEINAAQKLGFAFINLKKTPLEKIAKKLQVLASYQWQYVPEINKIKTYLKCKLGYPTSLYQSLSHIRNVSNLSTSPFLDIGNFNYFINNPGDPFFLSQNYMTHSCLFEQEVIRMLGKFYGLSALEARGFVTSGGTEGNFSGLWWARDFFGKKRTAVYFSTAAHYSVAKIAEQLNLEAYPIAVAADETLDIDAFNVAIKNHMQHSPTVPLIVSANAGTVRYGAIDDVPAIKKILDQQVVSRGGKYIIHLDAACSGAVLPLMKPFGKNIKNYFTELGISTLSISGHKFFGLTDICGVILTTQEFLDHSTRPENKKIAYVGQIHDITPSGSRSGNNVLQMHNIFYNLDMHRDRARLKELLKLSLRNCTYFYKRICQLLGDNQVVWLKNSFSIIFSSPSFDLVRKYSLMPIPGNKAGVYGLINLTPELTDQFIKEYQKELTKKH